MQPEHKDKGGGRARGDVDKDHTHMITREVTDKCKGKEEDRQEHGKLISILEGVVSVGVCVWGCGRWGSGRGHRGRLWLKRRWAKCLKHLRCKPCASIWALLALTRSQDFVFL
jgi:hypothetical protein